MTRRSVLAAICLLVGWWPHAVSQDVVVNEIHYDPPDKTVPEEFLELHNRGADAVDASGWFFSSGITYRFPAGSTIEPGGYWVVAQDAATFRAAFGFEADGEFEGRLSSQGERVTLRNRAGRIIDEVDYQVGFPWPIASAGRGSSMELMSPELDNDLGGSWRASGLIERPFREREYFLTRESGEWWFRRATSEASEPTDAWRQREFELDGTWEQAQASIGFGDDDDNTVLDDMRDNYTGLYLRHTFVVGELPETLSLGLFVDDGAVVWINGIEVHREAVGEGELAFDGTASNSHEARWADHPLGNPSAFLREGENTIAIHAVNLRASSADFSIDAELFVPGTIDEDPSGLLPPTPGARNSVSTESIPPQIRQVGHEPQQPSSEQAIALSAKVTDPQGVGAVTALVQLVAPGEFIPAYLPLPHATLLSRPLDPNEPNPEFEDPASWFELPMRDDGLEGDLLAGDGVWTVVVPPQPNRTLVRYRVRASDAQGAAITVPYRDDHSLNFACFVYDGVPAYQASLRSVHPEGAGHVYPVEVMTSLPVHIVLTREEDMTHAVAYSGSFQIPKSNERARDKFNWEGAFVYDGVVYDHIRYRLRQANDRYGGSGKRSMRFRFNKGHYLQARDNWGRKYPTRWRTLNTGKQFDNKRVGNFGVTEQMNATLWNMVGVPAPHFYTFHMRVIDGPDEVPDTSTGQYLGDFWGMFSGIEDYDPRFLEAHGLEDGNLYKLKDGQFNGNDLKRNQGRFATTTDADFQNIRRNLRPTQTDEWLDAHVNYDRWYPYHAVVEGIRHYDFVPADSHSKNRAWYFEPDYERTEFGRLWTLPWDSDASWGPNWNSGIDYSKNAIYSGGGKPAFKQKYRNFIREFRDLLWTEETLERMIDDIAAFSLEFHRADRDRWRGAPAVAGSQDFGPMEAKIVDMKRFAFVGWSGSTGPTVPAGGRARHLENLAAAEGDASRIPDTPQVIPVLGDRFPQDELVFESSPFSDPQEEDSFAGMMWRLGEIEDRAAPGFDPLGPTPFEWNAVWSSGLVTEFVPRVAVPASAVRVGHRYRVRVKMLDDTGRWSHWSDPVEFVVEPPSGPIPAIDGLRVTELMFHPVGDDGFEFIELRNVSSTEIDLSAIRLADGVDFDFADADVRSLAPGERVVVVADREVFETRYPDEDILVAGEYDGRLANGGERIELRFGAADTILAFSYSDLWYPTTDGQGFSLVIRDELSDPAGWSEPEAWRASDRFHGSPGREDEPSEEGFQLPADISQNGRVDIQDAVVLLAILVGGSNDPLPCGDGSFEHESNQFILDVNGDRVANLTDAVHVVQYLFRRGDPPALGQQCIPVLDCPFVCGF